MLKCRVNTSQFQEALKKLEVVRPNKSQLKILENIVMTSCDGIVRLIATDLENYVIATITDSHVESHENIVVTNVKGIMKSFKFMNEVYTEIEANNRDITITNGSRKIKVLTMDYGEYPTEPQLETIDNEYTYNTKFLYNRIKKVDFAISKDQTRPILTGINFNNSDIVALDGYRLAINTDNKLTINKPFTIAPGTINFLTKTLNKKNEDKIIIKTNDNHIIFEYEDVKVISRLLEGKYFSYNEVLPRDFNGIVTVDTKKFKEDIDFLSVYSGSIKHELTVLTITDGTMELKANNQQGIFSIKHSIDSDYKIKIGFNNKYMLETLKVIETETIDICFVGDKNPMIIKESDNEKYMILPVRLENVA